MMTSDNQPKQAFVWVWRPDDTTPVVAGRLDVKNEQILFTYGRSYLDRADAIPLYEPELPLIRGELPLLNGLRMPSCIRDAAPDAWGRRVIINRRFGAQNKTVDTDRLDELTYLLNSGSDRIGALDFQTSATDYVARTTPEATLDELLRAASKIEQGIPLSPEIDLALLHGSSIGGARPKALITDGDKKYVAKFSSQSDIYNVIKAEYVAMRLAAYAGINVAPVTLQHVAGKDVLLIERFDRHHTATGWSRRAMVSALTLLGLDEMMARYASYQDLAEIIRHRFVDPQKTLTELFARLMFNILCGNTDDHARNHSAFWDGRQLRLTPAYDICPQGRAGGEATQAMLIAGDDRMSRIDSCLKAAPQFLLSERQAIDLAANQIIAIQSLWPAICDEAELSEVDRNLFWRRQFLNPFAFDSAPPSLIALLS